MPFSSKHPAGVPLTQALGPNQEQEISIWKCRESPSAPTTWSEIARIEHKGESGHAYWRTLHFGSVRVRMVEYTPGYRADHWCVKGHVLLCLEGELSTELKDGRTFKLKPGMSYQVADNAEPHRSFTNVGARLFIID